MKSKTKGMQSIPKLLTGFLALLLVLGVAAGPQMVQAAEEQEPEAVVEEGTSESEKPEEDLEDESEDPSGGEKIKMTVWYYYVKTDGGLGYYEEIYYAPAGSTWGSFLTEYTPCFKNGKITDAMAGCEWDDGRGDPSALPEYLFTDMFKLPATGTWHRYYGMPSTYKNIGLNVTVYENNEPVAGGWGYAAFMPKSYRFGSEEAIGYLVSFLRAGYSEIEEECSKPGATVEVEAVNEATETTWDLYYVKIYRPSNTSSAVTGSPNYSQEDTTYVLGESTYFSESGQAMRRVTVEGNNSISIDGAQEYLPAGSKFACAAVTSGDTYERAASLVAQRIRGAAGFRVFDFSLTDASNMAIHQLNGYVNVTLPIPDGLDASGRRRLTVYRIEDDGALTRCTTATANGYLTFATNHFSTYVIVEETTSTATSPKTGEENSTFFWGLAALAAGLSGIYSWNRRRLTMK